jgi:uncharacterized protein YchJ
MNEPDCYCGNQKNYKDCCQPFLTGRSKPESPEQLMKSRYAAFCTEDIHYLISTHHPSRRQVNEWNHWYSAVMSHAGVVATKSIKGAMGDDAQ